LESHNRLYPEQGENRGQDMVYENVRIDVGGKGYTYIVRVYWVMTLYVGTNS